MCATLIGFMGTGNYRYSQYVVNDETEVRTPYVTVALAKVKRPSRILMFMTADAKNQHYTAFQNELRVKCCGDISLDIVDVPLGRNEGELWVIFRRIVENVEPGMSVIFDITHGLRSFPILGILSLSYLQFSIGIDLQGLYYGAYDVGVDTDLVSTDGYSVKRVPVFELSPFISLLPWMAGVNDFNRYGDSRELAKVLLKVGASSKMEELAERLSVLSTALMIGRPEDVEKSVEDLGAFQSKNQAQMAEEIQRWAQPFELVSDKILKEYQELMQPEHPLERRLGLVEWYLKRQHISQAMTLLRETMVSRVILVQEGSLENENKLKSVRERAEQWLNSLCCKTSPLGKIWREIGNVRNDIAHCGFRINRMRLGKIVEKANICFEGAKVVFWEESLWALAKDYVHTP